VITQRDLVQRLARTTLAAWSVVERVQDIAIADDRGALQRRDHRTRLALIVHQDIPRGRGSARLDLDAFDGSATDLIDQAISLALAAVGPAWSSTPPAAPARVSLADQALLRRELDAVAASTLARLRRPPAVTVTASAEILRENVTVIASSGFHTRWLATALRADAVVSLPAGSGPHGLTLSREARRIEDLALDAPLANAAADLLRLAAAGPPTSGPCALWLGPEALLHGDDYGVWTIFAHLADSTVERQGLTRYRWRSEIAPGAAQLAEPLSITSNGALDFATRSTPVTDDAVAIRRFPIIHRGIAVGLGLSPREAALRHTDPNGGVRNLVVAPGTWPGTLSTTSRTIEVRRLHALSIDLDTGEATLDIALGLEHRLDRPEPIPFTGGTIRLDLVTALARARRASQLLRRGAYHGPASILIDDAELMT
jgi:predicted Zn-dependent protease